jgi:hypothetical protein
LSLKLSTVASSMRAGHGADFQFPSSGKGNFRRGFRWAGTKSLMKSSCGNCWIAQSWLSLRRVTGDDSWWFPFRQSCLLHYILRVSTDVPEFQQSHALVEIVNNTVYRSKVDES